MHRKSSLTVVGLVLVVLVGVSPGRTQVISTGQVAGTVLDPSGAIIPGAQLELKDEGTGALRKTVAASAGNFVFPSLSSGTYTLTATMQGFQTAVYSGIIVNSGRTTDIAVTLKLGQVNQTVEVQGASPVVETSTVKLSTTVEQKNIQDLPLGLREVTPFALLMTGASRGNTDRDSTFNGLPGGAVQITINGINDNAQRWKSAGTSFFAFSKPRLEALEEVTTSTSNLGSDTGGAGGMTAEFTQKRGTNRFHGEGFWQTQNNGLNANDWFNNARAIKRPAFILNDFGGNFGGPLIKDKLFIFGSYGQTNQVGGNPRDRFGNTSEKLILNQQAEQGLFSYVGTDGATRTVNLLQVAGAQGFAGQVDPIIAGQFAKIDQSRPFGAITRQDPRIDRIRWVTPQTFKRNFPTVRIDWEPRPTLRFNVFDIYTRLSQAGTTIADLPGPAFKFQETGHFSNPYVAGAGFTWIVRPNMTNEFKAGLQGNQESFNPGQSIKDRLPRRLVFPLGLTSGADNFSTPFPRNNPITLFSDRFSLQHGAHTFTFGGDVMKATVHETGFSDAGIPRFSFGVVGSDPASKLFNSTNLPNVKSDDLGNAFDLYALLTGRVSFVSSSRNADEKTKQFADFQPRTIRDRRTSYGFYAGDSWRVRPSLTLSGGLRWDFQGDVQNTNGLATSPTVADLFGPSGATPGSGANLFNPGVLLGIQNPQLFQRSKTYKADFINAAPNFGLAWNPSFSEGLLGSLFGDKKTVLRGGYSINYFSEGSNNIQFNVEQGNPGTTQQESLFPGAAGFVPGGLSVSSPLPPFLVNPSSFSFPIPLSAFTFQNGFVTVASDIKAPYVENWSFGIERELTSSTAVEVRYVGNRGVHLWRRFNLNEVNIFENGFLKEFINAQKNLAINKANGVNSFANLGSAGEVPLPIFEAAFGGLGSKGPVSSGAGFGSSSFITILQQGQAGALAQTLAGNSNFFCRLVGNTFGPCAGLGFDAQGKFPINFFQLNPFAAGNVARLVDSNSFSSYNALQIEFRRKFSRGLTFNANYTWSHGITDRYTKDQGNGIDFTTLRNVKLDRAPFPWDRRHTLQFFGSYDLPIGRGRAVALNNRVLDRVAGGWTVGWIFRVQSGLPFKLGSGRRTVNNNDSGLVLAPGVTTSQLQDRVTNSFTNSGVFAFDPNVLGPDGRISSKFGGPPTVPGEFGSFVYLHGPGIAQTDLSLTKRIAITEAVKAEFQAEFVNAFNHPAFQVPGNAAFSVDNVNALSTSFGLITSTVSDPRNIQLRLRFFF